MKLTVKTLKGELIELDVASNETVIINFIQYLDSRFKK
jgi:hypothetical protein